MTQLLCRRYANERYSTYFSPATGFFARIEDAGSVEPFWSEHGPEVMDIAITRWCDRACGVCYQSAHDTGSHKALGDYERVIRQAAALGVYQVALGGGNPNQHPDFVRVLEITRDRFGIVPKYTTNGRGLTGYVLAATKRLCGAVAVSAYEPECELENNIRRLIAHGVRVNVHFIVDRMTVDRAITWLKDPPAYLNGINAIIFLNYKAVGRGSNHDRLLSKSDRWRLFFETALGGKRHFKVGFDSCMVSGLALNASVDSVWYDACEAGRFSMYVSDRLVAYPCSFMAAGYDGSKLEDDNLLAIWQMAPLFDAIRTRLRQATCEGCPRLKECRGGCPVFPEINVCEVGRAMQLRALVE